MATDECEEGREKITKMQRKSAESQLPGAGDLF
jgi:hypothetical protein